MKADGRASGPSEQFISNTNYIKNIEDNIGKNPSKFWSHIRLLRNENSIPGIMSYKGDELTDLKSIVNSFADHFQQSYVQSQSSPLSTVTSSSVLCISKFEEEDVFKALRKIKSKFTSGPDGVPAFILNDCANAFAYPLTILFNLSLKLSIYPSLWKRSVIRPIFKNGDRTLIEKYRPISLMCNFSKVYEILLYDIICYCRPYISSFQHGFYKGRSIDTNLCCFTQFVAESLNAEVRLMLFLQTFQKRLTGWTTSYCLTS